jgi:hypothetical protein
MPGPLLAYNVRESARLGFWAGPLVSSGHSLLELLVVVLLALGLTRLLHRETVLALVGLAGGGFSCGWPGGWFAILFGACPRLLIPPPTPGASGCNP